MKSAVVVGFAFVAVCALGSAQAPLAFEAASIKPSPPPAPGNFMVMMNQDGGRITYVNQNLRSIVAKAYQVKEYQIVGPAWLAASRFDITATFPAGATKDDVPEMLRTLLAERFKMAAHSEEKVVPVYGLVVGKTGLKIKPADPTDNAPLPPPPPTGAGGNLAPPRALPPGAMRFMMGPKGRKMTGDMSFAQFANFLSNTLDRPVIDETGTSGTFKMSLEWTPDASENRGMGGMPLLPRMPSAPPSGEKPAEADTPDAPGIFTAIQEQLGLRLEPRKGSVKTVTIDRIEKVPTEN